MNGRSIPNWIWIAVGGLLLTVSPLIFFLPRYTTSSPSYCLTCHGEDGGLANRGIESKVHPSFAVVTCTDCHAKPRQIVYEGYREGFTSEPERVSPNCIRCHRGISGRNDQVGFRFNPLQILIPHKLHLGLGAKCTDCHANIAHDLREPQTNRPRMEYCSQCHATTVEPCAKCHAGGIPSGPPPSPFPAGLAGDGRGLYSRYCANCHGTEGDRVAGVDLKSREFLGIRSFATLRIIVAEGHGGMPSFGELLGGPLTDDEIRAIIAYLKLSSEGFATNGPSLYASNCVVCHGAEGKKMPTVDLSSAEFINSLGREGISRAIREGKGGMPAFSKPAGGPLSYEEIEAIVRYVVSLAGAPPKPELDLAALYGDNCAACHGEDGSRIPSANLGSAEF
ncbi:MAG: c-type cytochrome, partial [Candidatus Bipolaricaulia bacterium]